jgi:predicted  nucleic acid-binding Zn-ribbon protein
MNSNLERLIALQRLDSTRQAAVRRLAEEPDRLREFEARLETVRAKVAAAKARLTENQNARRDIEKDVAVHQGRLSKFREQAMAVKTNQEYHAIQHEIAFAESEVKKLEDKILERMLENDDLTAELKRSESELASEQKAVDADRNALAAELSEVKQSVERMQRERAELVGHLDPRLLATFEMVARRRNGVAVSEARDGVCTICHVRLRPQIFNTVRRNEEIIQCDSCNRILYFVPAPAVQADTVERGT